MQSSSPFSTSVLPMLPLLTVRHALRPSSLVAQPADPLHIRFLRCAKAPALAPRSFHQCGVGAPDSFSAAEHVPRTREAPSALVASPLGRSRGDPPLTAGISFVAHWRQACAPGAFRPSRAITGSAEHRVGTQTLSYPPTCSRGPACRIAGGIPILLSGPARLPCHAPATAPCLYAATARPSAPAVRLVSRDRLGGRCGWIR